MSKLLKQTLLLISDIIIIFASQWFAALLRYEGEIPEQAYRTIFLAIYISIIPVILLTLIVSGYKLLWRYVGIEVLIRQGFVAAISTLLLLTLKYTILTDLSGSICVIYGILLFGFSSGIRIAPRAYLLLRAILKPAQYHTRRAIIIGAGETGTTLIKRAREAEGVDNFYPLAVIDNDKRKHGTKASGVPIIGDIDDIAEICKKYNATEIIVALPNASKDDLYDIYKKCIKSNLPIKTSQSLVDVKDYMQTDGTALKNVTIEDLLFREVIKNDMTPVEDFMRGRVVMVTGGAGSIGSELCRQALEYGCGLLIIFDINENALYEINEELSKNYDTGRYILSLGSIRDEARLDEVMRRYKPYIVFHAAAHKHVPMLELNPFEAVKNNIKGTINVIEASIKNNVHKFILISTDKAVNPVNILGASKRVAELVVENMKSNGTHLAAVRFGNVLGSIGSVIPQFKRQIASGGPVTVTHKDIVRFFMTISEAVSLVLTAGTLAKDGEIFILDMGKPVKIYDLATDLIRLSGYEPNTDIKIEITGLRPGEKLYEELFITGEQIDATTNEKIFVLKGSDVSNFDTQCNRILELTTEGSDETALREALFELARTES